VVPRQEANYREDVAVMRLFRNGQELGTVETMKRLYVTRGMPTTEAGILTTGLGQVYASLGEVQADGSVGVRLYHKPLVLLIWIGALVMAAGGALSLTDRRLRIGAPAPARPAPPTAAVPAE
jgi:cytochrome c-type biogenesis protein CcmF